MEEGGDQKRVLEIFLKKGLSLSEPRAHLSYGKKQSEQSCLCSPKRPDYRHLLDAR